MSIMSISTIPVICYYNINILRTETNVKYVENKAIIVPLDVSVVCTFPRLNSWVIWYTQGQPLTNKDSN